MKQYISTILALGFAAGLAVSSYHMSENINYKNAYYDSVVNNKNTKIAIHYQDVSSDLAGVEESMRQISLDKNVNSFSDNFYSGVDDIILKLEKIDGAEKYSGELIDLTKDILMFDKIERSPEEYKQITTDLLSLKSALKQEVKKNCPEINSINERIQNYKNRYAGCICGIVFGSFGLIGFGSWAGYEWKEAAYFFNENRTSKRRRTTRI